MTCGGTTLQVRKQGETFIKKLLVQPGERLIVCFKETYHCCILYLKDNLATNAIILHLHLDNRNPSVQLSPLAWC